MVMTPFKSFHLNLNLFVLICEMAQDLKKAYDD